MNVHVNRFVNVIGTRPLEHQSDAGRIKMRLEARGALECADIELVRIFKRYLGLVGNGFRHRWSYFVLAGYKIIKRIGRFELGHNRSPSPFPALGAGLE